MDMIYFDNGATTLQKPSQVAQAIMQGVHSLGNAGRSFYDPAMEAAREIYRTRQEVARLVELQDPLFVAFTSGATESLNLVLDSLVTPEDHVITTVLEHNSVLRPLYKIGCALSFIPCDETGRLVLDGLQPLLRHNTRFLVCTHGSNLTGAITDVVALKRFCENNGLVFVLDVSQTLGHVATYASMADVLCFTGHKALFGPQGTGGIIVNRPLDFKLVKTGGSGSDSFSRHQRLAMPDLFEAGTMNASGLAGLRQGVAYVNEMGIDAIRRQEHRLLSAFLAGVVEIPGVRLYGPTQNGSPTALPIVALNMGDLPADDVALQLWERWRIATRTGSHCAPLVHRHFGTENQGMVRFSFGLFNTLDEINTALAALKQIAAQGRGTHGG